MDPLSRFGISIENDGIESAAVYGLVLTFSCIEKRIVEYLRAYNLTPSQFNALMIINHLGKDKGLSQVEISQKLIISASNMTRLLDKLHKDALIHRFPSTEDRRVNHVQITEEGINLLDAVWPGYYKIIKDISRLLSKNELENIYELSIKWFNMLEKLQK